MRNAKRRTKDALGAHVRRRKVSRVRGWYRNLHGASATGEIDLDIKLGFVPAPKGMPKSQKICGQVWRVLYSNNLLFTRGLYGVTIPGERVITIDATGPEAKLKDVLFHELIHVCFNINDSWTMSDSPPDEEVIVRALCPVLLDWLRSNKRWW